MYSSWATAENQTRYANRTLVMCVSIRTPTMILTSFVHLVAFNIGALPWLQLVISSWSSQSQSAYALDVYNSLCSCPSPSVSAITTLAASAASASLLLIASLTPSVASEATELAVELAELAVFSMIESGLGTPAMPINSVSKTNTHIRTVSFTHRY